MHQPKFQASLVRGAVKGNVAIPAPVLGRPGLALYAPSHNEPKFTGIALLLEDQAGLYTILVLLREVHLPALTVPFPDPEVPTAVVLVMAVVVDDQLQLGKDPDLLPEVARGSEVNLGIPRHQPHFRGIPHEIFDKAVVGDILLPGFTPDEQADAPMFPAHLPDRDPAEVVPGSEGNALPPAAFRPDPKAPGGVVAILPMVVDDHLAHAHLLLRFIPPASLSPFWP